ncbi:MULTISPECIES: DUF1496 domain-containing protein [Erwinia]|uniref:YnjH family protein n=1 Tax=Erwinia pyrifoliae TaxID=79967 RepID=A0ABY5XD02_ERWPY|nr:MULTISPECIES: DUF1496 domain-containing protein [Erwinia]ADP12738.1 conserved uncharacterized protein [Erwinia sp. Ejp617]AUX72866.1 DUF1496 domain-containing protein [Erwinia pyrifoliae]MCA8876864.1 DUF1496 domain-containing protein [Erwinia pyrifoliae]MCT2387021.1 YnjH family protein [Erwinia pyrifoliae]MCU8587380.1 YnjH family protein [Erwinia pyrifoliae]
MRLHLTLIVLLGLSASALAERVISNNGNQDGINTDVVVDMPREVWTQGGHDSQPPCQRCCVYENRHYTEGAVLKSEGVLLQCVRDENSLGTNNLIWRMVK